MDGVTEPAPAAVLLGGPTSSGKSSLALSIAGAFGGTLVNADSMQVYRDLRVLTARPSDEDEARCPHRLFGFLGAETRCSVGLWHGRALAECRAAAARGSVAVLAGGTGLYLAAFRHGLAPVPDTPAEIRATLEARMAASGPEVLHRELAGVDGELAAVLAPSDRQRIQRGLEVHEATGTPLSAWRRRPRRGAWPGPVLQITLVPPRDALYRLCDRRFDAMLENGALGEVARLAARRLDRSLPAMRVLGVPHLMAHLDGRMDLESAAARARADTRRYAKRQTTWFRHQVPDALRVEGFGFESAADAAQVAVGRFLRESGLC